MGAKKCINNKISVLSVNLPPRLPPPPQDRVNIELTICHTHFHFPFGLKIFKSPAILYINDIDKLFSRRILYNTLQPKTCRKIGFNFVEVTHPRRANLVLGDVERCFTVVDEEDSTTSVRYQCQYSS